MDTTIFKMIMPALGIFIAVFFILFLFRVARKKNRFSPFTEKILRSPGYSLGKQLDDNFADSFYPILVLTLFPVVYAIQYYSYNQSTKYVMGVIVAGAIGWSLFRIKVILDRAQTLRLGMDGEVYTGQELNYLMRYGAWVFHDIPYQYGNIDHVIVSTGGVFAVETKARRKPANGKGTRQSKVFVEGKKLHFPDIVFENPINQASIHASNLEGFLKRRTGKTYPVTPVVALPGWYIELKERNNFLVINPKRGASLKNHIERKLIPMAEAENIANQIEEFARSVPSGSDKTDPDANTKYDFWLNRKPEDKKL